MSKKIILLSLCIIVVIFATWKMAILSSEYKKFNHITQAIPVVRFDRFDKQRNALIIGLFNPGTLAMEINHTELSFQRDDKHSRVVYSHHEYGEKPLVLDPGDTILIPLQRKPAGEIQSEKGSYWGILYFQVPGQSDFYSLYHQFNNN